MLLNLHVRNFALIREADIDFDRGLNILTGETGAGKSLLIDAVNAALGQRARPDLIRAGCDSAYIEMVFSVEPEKKAAIEALDISTEYDCIIISRRITPGRSIHKINDETVSSARVRQVTSFLIDIHGQHEHQSLMKKEQHLAIIDQFGGPEAEQKKQAMSEAWQRFTRAKTERERWSMDEAMRQREMDFLSYEIEEIEAADPKPGEREELSARFRKLSNSRKILSAIAETEQFLETGADSASEKILRSSRELAKALRYDESLEDFAGQLSQIGDLISGLAREMADYREELEMDPEEFSRVEERLDLLQRLESKYGSEEELREGLERRRERLAELTSFEEKKARAERELTEARREMEEAAAALGEVRHRAVPGLTARLTGAIRDLNFSYVDFVIREERLPEPARNGWDAPEFLISLNAGEAPKPLGQVASGGELSRIMLAIKAVLADRDEIPTLIFDEIDSGISGRTAQKVSEKLAVIGRHRQVICITHLPQIASMADQHYAIRKASENDHTITSVERLTEQGMIEELARLLGGARVTGAVYENAREMKRLADEEKMRGEGRNP